MTRGELLRFLIERFRNDNFIAFVCRLLRFAIIAFFSMKYNVIYKRMSHNKMLEVCGIKMNTPGSDTGISRDLAMNKSREPYITRAYTNLIKEGDVVLEAGANIGYYALQAAKLVGETGLVYAIEPVSQNMEVLKGNIELNNFNNIESYQLAIGDENGKGNIMISEKGNWCAMEKTNTARAFVSSEKVNIVSVDSFLRNKRTPDFLRMDIEGYEYNVIKGMGKLLEKGIPQRMFIEVHFDILRDKAMEMFEILKENDYEIIVATVEPHPAVQNSLFGIQATALLDRFIGVGQGYIDIKIDDILKNPIFRTGQVEWMEIIFEKETRQ